MQSYFLLLILFRTRNRCFRILAHALLLTKPRCIVIHRHNPNSTRDPAA
jgi:hypothetical protein